MLKVGDKIPNFTAMCTDGTLLSSENLKGKWSVIFFYPKAFTPGCTKEVCSLRDGFELLSKFNINLYGVSKDDIETQKNFKEKYKFPYELIADKDGEIIKSFGVSGLFGFAKRVTFIIDPEGRIAEVIDKVRVSDHYLQIAETLQKFLK
ncbi:MAG: peroxiredoxin [Candidatus Kryptonium sp.]